METKEDVTESMVNAVKKGDISWLDIHTTPHQLATTYVAHGFTLLHWACSRPDIAVLKYLLDAGCPPCQPAANPQAAHPIHWAATHGRVANIELLMSRGEEIDVRDSAGLTPLLMAAQFGQPTVAVYLMGKGCSLRAADQNGDTALHWAAFKGHPDIVTLLIYSGFNPHQRDKFGQTPLHLSCLAGHLDTVKQLCTISEVNVEDRDGNARSAVDLAKGRGHYDVVSYLETQATRLKHYKPIAHIWFALFGAPGKSKLPMIFFILSFLLWAYPIYFYKVFGVVGPLEIHITFFITNVIMWYTFHRAKRTEPGFIPCNTHHYELALKQISSMCADDVVGRSGSILERMCHTCRTMKPLRSKHCKICNRCVKHFDHHCPWIYNCVGLNNRVWFFGYAVSTALTLSLASYFSYSLILIGGWTWLNIIILLESILFNLITVILSFGTCFQAFMNMTTNEIYNTQKYSYLRDKNGNIKNPFFKGPIHNFMEFFHITKLPLVTIDGGVFVDGLADVKIM